MRRSFGQKGPDTFEDWLWWWSMSRWSQFRVIFFLSLCAWLAVTGLIWLTFEATAAIMAHFPSNIHLLSYHV